MISEGTDLVDAIIYTRRVSRYLEKKYLRRFGSRNIGICNNR